MKSAVLSNVPPPLVATVVVVHLQFAQFLGSLLARLGAPLVLDAIDLAGDVGLLRGVEAHGALVDEPVLEQMDQEATREYFAASLFLNYVTYENEMAERLASRVEAWVLP